MVVVDDVIIGFIRIVVGIFVDVIFPTTALVSSPDPLDEPIPPLYPPCYTCIGRGAFVGSQSAKFRIGANSALILDTMFKTLAKVES